MSKAVSLTTGVSSVTCEVRTRLVTIVLCQEREREIEGCFVVAVADNFLLNRNTKPVHFS